MSFDAEVLAEQLGQLGRDKTCTSCLLPKPFFEFYFRQDRQQYVAICNVCRSDYQSDWLHRNPASIRRKTLKAHGLTEVQYDALLATQGGGCGVCGTNSPGGKGTFHIDHDHRCCPGKLSCGKCVRGLLCFGCNNGAGSFGDDPQLLRKAADYLERSIYVV